MRIHEGTTVPVNDQMNAVNANVLREDGVLQRTCEHGVRHPVGDLHRDSVKREELEAHALYHCCPKQCCAAWRGEA